LRILPLIRAALLALLLAAPVAAAPPSRALTAGAVAAPDRYGALAAQEILKAGGNAVDAAVATAFALAVTYPEAGNIGGGGFMTLYVDGKPYFLDYRETAPAKASATMYLDAKGDVVPDLSLVGPLAAGVPGTVRGMEDAHRRFGKLSWARDLAPAIRLAGQGYLVSPKAIGIDDPDRAHFAGKTNFERYFGAMKAGRTFRQPELAATLQRIAQQGAKGFYEGKTADLIVAQMNRGPAKGLISHGDLAGYKAAWRAPIEGDWRGMHVITAPPPSSGGIALLQMLAMKADDAELFKGVGLNTPQYLHLVSEIEKRVFADRAEYLGDPDFVKVPVAALTDPAYIARRAREVDPVKPSVLASVRPGLEKPQTTHFSVVDRWGNAVSNTYTLNGWYGSGVVVEGAGFVLNDEMDDFSAKPGQPNQFGVVGGDANAIGPGKRPLSSMTPTIITRDGRVAMVIGTPGGSRIFTWVFQVLANVYDFGQPLPKALATPRFHHQLLPENTIFAEQIAPLPAKVTAAMAKRGYRIDAKDFSGDIEAIQVTGGVPRPGSDPRARGLSLVIP
jgi:gamma-glutamyltranspeptidase/glutathione hydrolase